MGRRDVEISELIISMATTAPLDDPRTLPAADQPDKLRVPETPSGENIFSTVSCYFYHTVTAISYIY